MKLNKDEKHVYTVKKKMIAMVKSNKRQTSELTHCDSMLAHGKYLLFGHVNQQSVPEIGVADTLLW
jgi:hypothetical protein